jgi:thiol-disulfide isomerase/thioredoxin
MFTASWLPTCRAMHPVVDRVSEEYSDQIEFVFLDVDDPANNEAKEKYGYR